MTDTPDMLIAEFDKNNREIVRAQIRNWKNTRNVDIRVYVKSKDAPDPIATGKGISLKPELLPALIEALHKAEEAARKEGLLL